MFGLCLLLFLQPASVRPVRHHQKPSGPSEAGSRKKPDRRSINRLLQPDRGLVPVQKQLCVFQDTQNHQEFQAILQVPRGKHDVDNGQVLTSRQPGDPGTDHARIAGTISRKSDV